MIDFDLAIKIVRKHHKDANKQLAVVLAGHNGSGKSTMWNQKLADGFQIPLVNADRMMLSILPEMSNGRLRSWAQTLRDEDHRWMAVAQKGVQSFIGHARDQRIAFAVETVFSHWQDVGGNKFRSKIDLIEDLQRHEYFVLLLFVGLQNSNLSIARVQSRTMDGGHAVPIEKLQERFPRTQRAISEAIKVADASVLIDNSFGRQRAFMPCRVQIRKNVLHDIRHDNDAVHCGGSGFLDRWIS